VTHGGKEKREGSRRGRHNAALDLEIERGGQKGDLFLKSGGGVIRHTMMDLEGGIRHLGMRLAD